MKDDPSGILCRWVVSDSICYAGQFGHLIMSTTVWVVFCKCHNFLNSCDVFLAVFIRGLLLKVKQGNYPTLGIAQSSLQFTPW